MQLADLIYRISTDSQFARLFRAAPESALSSMNLLIADDDLAAVLKVLDAKIDQSKPLIDLLPSLPWFIPQFQN